MTIGRMIAVTAMVFAAIGLTTQAEAAKRKNIITLEGCAYWQLFCGPVMRDIAGNLYTFVPPEKVPPFVPLKVTGKKSSEIYVGLCKATRIDVISVKSAPSCAVSAR